MYERSANDIHLRFVLLMLLSCILAVVSQPYLSNAAVLMERYKPQVAELSGVVLSEPISTEVRSGLSGRLVAVNVDEGMEVKAGDIIARVEPEQFTSDVEAIQLELASLQLQRDAVRALKRGQTAFEIAPSEVLMDTWSPTTRATFAEVQSAQRELVVKQAQFAQLRQTYEAKQVQRLTHKAELQKIIRAKCEAQLKSLMAERARIADLVAHGTFPLNRSADLERQTMAVELRLAEADAQAADVESELDNAKLAVAEQAKSRWEDWNQKEQDLTARIAEVRVRLDSQNTSIARADVRAPHDGVVRNLRNKFVGLSVAAGDTLLDVARNNQSFVVEVTADAAQLPKIEPGGLAQVWIGDRAGSISKAIRATVEGVSNDDEQKAQNAQRTFYLTIDDSVITERQRETIRTGAPVAVQLPEAGTLTQLRDQTERRASTSG